MNLHTRREFLSTGLKGAGLLTAGAFVPSFVLRTAAAAEAARDASVLVVVQLSGGNDGLNTVVPHGDDLYARARPSLRLKESELLQLDDHLGLHPALRDLKAEFDAGRLAIVQNAGYPNPNRSHFRSMEIWHTASDQVGVGTGWLGRYFDAQCAGTDPRARPGEIGLSFGKVTPQAFRNRSNVGVAIEDPETFQWNPTGETSTLAKAQKDVFARMNRPADRPESGPIDFLRHTAMNAVVAGDRIRALLRKEDRRGRYPNCALAAQLRMVARLIAGKFPSRVYYVNQGGYDTHSGQAGSHARLLADFGGSVGAFLDDLRRDKVAERVVVVAFSEFGRRVAENGSAGTDHGAAAPMFIVGDRIQGGLHGPPPDLKNLVDGDVRHTVDFRQVYAGLLEDWLATPAGGVLGNGFEKVGLVGA